ncbi:MAG: NADH:ubiquinone reductase (Na(+)-transporting) subunit C, partial [Porphyromonadaceae bacterium]|nr:NADH:ubiquinone reductase (Na(+)-transporting) subunit C [Porphyromonadaceae bacterium]
ILYASIMVVVVAAVLAIAALGLKGRQTRNVEIDKMKQILSSVHVSASAKEAQSLYKALIIDSFVLNEKGDTLRGVEAFDVNVAVQVKLPASERQLPVYVCRLYNGVRKYILPVYGAGLWGPIWGYISLDADGNTLYGAYFAHESETPGLGAEIGSSAFQEQFPGKHLFVEEEFKSVAVEKKGQKPLNGAEYVNAISGGTITSKGVQAMLLNSLSPYEPFLKSLQQ